MTPTWHKYWQILACFWDWFLKRTMLVWYRGKKDAERQISTESVERTLAAGANVSRSSSVSAGPTTVPNVFVTDCDDEAEPYWKIMGELSDGCSNEDGCMGGSEFEGEGKQVLVGVCAMAKKSQSKPMKEILTRLEEFEYIKVVVFPEEVILKEPVEDWPIVDCLISFHSKGFPLDKAIHYANLRNPFNINNLPMQYDIQDRRRVYAILDSEGIEIPRYAVLDRDSADPKQFIPDHELVESEDHVEVNGVTFNKPFVEKPVSAEDHNIYIYYPTSAGGGSQRLFRKVRKRHSILPLTSSTGINKPNGKSYATDKPLEPIPMSGIGSRSSVYSPESRVRKTGSYIYEDFMPTDGTDVKVYTVGPDYAHAEARKSPALDGKVERDSEGKEIRYPVILSNAEKLISRKVCLAFKQTVCGFDLLRANGKSFVCDVNGFSFVKNSNKYYDDCAKILGNMILRELAPTLHIPWSVPFQLDDPPIVPTTFGKMMELRCVVAVIRHGDRTPKQKMKVEVRHPKFFEIFAKYDGYKHGHVKLKRPKQLQEILDTARSLLTEIQHRAAGPELEEKQGKLEQLKSVLEMYGHFSGINRKVQMKYQPRGRPRGSSSDDGNNHNRLGEPSLVLILKWGGELTPAGRIQAEELGRIFRCMYPGGQGRHLSEDDSEMLPSHGEYAGAQGLGLLRLHSTFRHDLKIYASDEGRVQMTAAAFAKGLLALEGELTPILVQMVKSANTNGLLDNDCDSSKYQNMVKTRLHELLQQDREFTKEDREQINPGNALSINDALDFVKNPVKCCQHVQALIQKLMDIVRIKKDDPKTKDAILYHGETWELMGRRWGKIEKDFCTKNKRFDISKIPDIYDCIKYDLQHNNHTLQFDHAEELYIYAKYLADIVIPQEYGLTVQEKLTIGQGICTPLLKKIRADLQRNIEESGEETVNRLNPRYSHGVSSPGRHVRTRLYFTSESHVHSLLTVLRYGGLLDVVKDEQWRRAMEYVSMVSELNYMSQIVVMLYEDPTKDPSSEERFHVELHFSPGVNCCVQKNLPPGPGFRPHSRNESSHNLETNSQCSTRIDEEDAELGGLEDGTTSPQQESNTSPVLVETEETPDTTLDSPTISRTIDMMDLDPNMMDEPYDSGFLQASAPIPISARTVAGHEAARLGSQLAASQRQRREREASGICEPRARSYDHQRQDKTEKTVEKLQYQSLDAVNKEDTRPSIIQQPDPTCTARRHRHSISGQMSYFKLLGYNVSKKLTGSTNSLFSTAVISGSSSAPNLKDMVPPHASAVAAIEGFGGVPPIRPLETLHNALSLRQLDSFLDMMTNASLFRTPASSPPKFPSPGGSTHGSSVIPNLSICNINREYHPSDLEAARYVTPTPMHYKSGLDGEASDNRNQLSPTSPNSAGWSSEPQSFLSSGPSSPAPTSAGECSMSISLVSSDGTQPFASSKASTTPRLDIEFNDFCRSIDQEMHAESRGSISYTDYYSNEDGLIRKTGSDLAHLRDRVAQDETSQDAAVDDDEDHTLTLRETEEHRKQDIKSIFDRNKDDSLVKPSSSFKKIGRFRVESMEIADEDVRIKEAGGTENVEAVSMSSSNLSLDRVKTARLKNRPKIKTMARSQSVSTPQSTSRKIDVDYGCQRADTNTGSFSTMSCEDLENWKRTAASPSASSVTSPTDVKEEPILTLASSLKGSSNIIIGFNVQDKKD
ncbi:inositol hexakisphosphate and diphosphoinositol-pentakisphosphate kinase 2 isoform X9 [Venturia canescens]|uniref:inositol hexakisphosphate and diphosphoinositol-pentakisphosphate kinase 2 isoform X9 n=1 Tax=Venturia canescens TaxID=32260 RepID=UPI001C9C6387|nr:inositol hexakisphosphate and diphosphoinositol-pentakisphosphate kinase 2 isoform X9 [Venturia canescens]